MCTMSCNLKDYVDVHILKYYKLSSNICWWRSCLVKYLHLFWRVLLQHMPTKYQFSSLVMFWNSAVELKKTHTCAFSGWKRSLPSGNKKRIRQESEGEEPKGKEWKMRSETEQQRGTGAEEMEGGGGRGRREAGGRRPKEVKKASSRRGWGGESISWRKRNWGWRAATTRRWDTESWTLHYLWLCDLVFCN